MNAALARSLIAACLIAPAAHAADEPKVEKCSRELGTLAVAEPQHHVLQGLSHYGLGSPGAMLRMMAQESGCFAVVERGVAMQNLQQERALAAGGQLQAGSNVGGGQMAVADFVMTPSVQFSGDSGGIGGAIGGLLGRHGGVLGSLGGLAGGVKFKEAETTLLIADVRSGIQVASAEGKASKMNFAIGGWGWGGGGWASGGGFTKTPEGKLIAASLLDNYNKIVVSVRDRPQLIRSTSQASQNNAAASIQATGPGGAAPAAAPAPTLTPVPLPPPSNRRANSGGPELPPGFYGNFGGQFIGAEQPGDFSVAIGANGMLTGLGRIGDGPTFTFTGMVAPSGMFMMRAQTAAGMVEFMGQLNGSSGELLGTWRVPVANGPQGSFSGKRLQ